MSTSKVHWGAALALLCATGRVGAAARVEPLVELAVQWNGNLEVVGEDTSSDTGVRASLTLPFTWEGPRSSTRLAYRLHGDLYGSREGQDSSNRNDLGHALAASHNRTMSRRSTLGFRLGASRSEQQGVLQESLGGEPDVPLPDTGAGLVPRTAVTRIDAGLSGRVGTGNRSFLSWGVGGRKDAYEDPPELDLADSSEYGVSAGWGYDVAEGASVSASTEVLRVDPQEGEAVDVLSLSLGGQRTLGRRLAGSLEMGASRADLQGGGTVTEPRMLGSLTWPLPPHASLALMASQSVGGGNGLVRSAAVERGASFGWRWSPPRGWTASATLAWRRTEPLDDAFDQGGTEALETRESVGWSPGGRVTYGLAHSWRKQDALDAAAEPYATDYHAFEAFVHWLPFGRRERRQGGEAPTDGN